MKSDFFLEGSIDLKLGPSFPAGLVQFVVAVPAELHGVIVAAASRGAGDAAEGELATGGFEEDVGGPIMSGKSSS